MLIVSYSRAGGQILELLHAEISFKRLRIFV